MSCPRNKEFMLHYHKHHQDLSNFCRSLERDPEQAKELMSETVSRAFVGFEKLKDPAKFKSFIFSIASNVLKETIRKKNRRLPFGNFLQKGNTSQAEDYTVQQILSLIPPKYAEVFVLFEIVDMPLNEISKVLGTNLSTVKTRLSRARKKLEELLQSEFSQYITHF